MVILDLDMPKCDGFSVVRELNRLRSPSGSSSLTLHTGADLILEAIDLGIRGYIIKSSAATGVAEEARRIAGGGNYLSEVMQHALQRGKTTPSQPAEMKRLSPMELRLVRKIAEGLTSRQIASSLDLSGRTIENYRIAICAKLNLTGPNAFLRFALTHRKNLLQRP